MGSSYSPTALAGTLTLSDQVSSLFEMNGVTPLPDPIDAANLDGTLDFVVVGTTLELTVTNLTSGDELFDINEVYFNAASNVTGLTYVSATHSVGAADVTGAWSLAVDPGIEDNPATQGDGFGIQDFALADGVGGMNPNDIGPTESITFEFTILGTGPFDMSDFTNTLSRQTTGGDNILIFAATKFANRRDSLGTEIEPNSSGYGGVLTPDFIIPEPSTLLLSVVGFLGLPLRRRRAIL